MSLSNAISKCCKCAWKVLETIKISSINIIVKLSTSGPKTTSKHLIIVAKLVIYLIIIQSLYIFQCHVTKYKFNLYKGKTKHVDKNYLVTSQQECIWLFTHSS